jgi:hypothetical protein
MDVYRSAVVAVIFFTHSALRLKNFPYDLARVAVDVNDLSESVETNKKKNPKGGLSLGSGDLQKGSVTSLLYTSHAYAKTDRIF